MTFHRHTHRFGHARARPVENAEHRRITEMWRCVGPGCKWAGDTPEEASAHDMKPYHATVYIEGD